MYPHPFRPITQRKADGTYLLASLIVISDQTAMTGQLPGNAIYSSQSVDILMVNTAAVTSYVTFASDQDLLPAADPTSGIPLPPNAMLVINLPGNMVWVSVLHGSVTFLRGLGGV